MDLHLTGKCALVTGSSRGLGFAISRLLASEGCRLVINGRNPENLATAARKLEAETGSTVIPIAGDVEQPDFPAHLVNQTLASLGGIDLLVTNTGGPPSGKFETLDDQVWQNAINLILLSHVRLIRAALPSLRNSKSASVVTITSYSVKQPIPNLVLSNSIRAATVGLTKSLSQELGADGIRMNSILPGWTLTERVQELMEFRARSNATTVEQEISRLTSEITLGRMARPEEVASAAVFLLSPVASYITGLMLTVDGGIYKGTL